MKNILIVTFYFSPCTLTPSQRITYWAENLHKLGYRPIIITRNWDIKVRSHLDTKVKVGKAVHHIKHEHYEVYYLPFKPGILDKAYFKWGDNLLRPLFMLVKVLDTLLVSYTLKHTSFYNFFPFVEELLKKEKINSILISGAPFYLFKIGYLAFKKYKIKWIADYRDDWSTNEIETQKGMNFFRGLINTVEAKYEKKWVGTADKIISVTEDYTDRITNFLKTKGITIENGFEEELAHLKSQTLFEDFTIVYSGTLYPFQDINIILEALKISLNKGKSFNLTFLGSGFDEKEKKRIEGIIDKPFQPFVKVTTRLPREEAILYLQKSHILLGISYGSLKGIPSSKLYEYIGLRKPVLLCPTDNDVMEGMLKEVGMGFFAKDPIGCYKQIEKIRKIYDSSKYDEYFKVSENNINKYSRGRQLEKIVDVL